MTAKSTSKLAETEELEKFVLGEGSKPEIGDSLLQAFHIFNSLENTISWIKLGLDNREEAEERLKNGEDPRPRFKKPDVERARVLELLNQVQTIKNSTNPEDLDNLGLSALDPADIGFLLENTSRSYKAYLNLVENLGPNNFRNPSRKIWGSPDERLAEKNLSYLRQEGYDHKPDGSVNPSELEEMFVDEVEDLGFQWNVETREVDGCFNDVDNKTLVVAEGSDETRFYTEKEAKLLTKHEVFHAARAYNGRQITGSTDFPEFTGLNTGFYDVTEEGGAVQREFNTIEVPKWRKDDYIVKQVCCHLLEDNSPAYTAEKLEEFGVPEERARDLVLKNMVRLRHHVYLEGTAKWSTPHESLMIGKVGASVAHILWKEVEEGNFEHPEVSLKDIS